MEIISENDNLRDLPLNKCEVLLFSIKGDIIKGFFYF